MIIFKDKWHGYGKFNNARRSMENARGRFACIYRHIFMFVLSALVALVSIYSTAAICRRLEKYQFEMIPLAINCLASVSMLVIFSRM